MGQNVPLCDSPHSRTTTRRGITVLTSHSLKPYTICIHNQKSFAIYLHIFYYKTRIIKKKLVSIHNYTTSKITLRDKKNGDSWPLLGLMCMNGMSDPEQPNRT